MTESPIYKPRRPQKIISSKTLFTGTSECKATISTTFPNSFEFLIESDTETHQPVKVVDDTIKIKQHLLKENKPYAFQYNSKDYLIKKTSGLVKLYELRD